MPGEFGLPAGGEFGGEVRAGGMLVSMDKRKKIAAFAAGVTAWEALVHTTLALSGALPLTLLGFTITPELNTVQIVAPAIISVACVYYAWFK